MKHFTLYIITNTHNFSDVLMFPKGEQPYSGGEPINQYDPMYQEENEKTVCWVEKLDIAAKNVADAVDQGVKFCVAYETANGDALQRGPAEWKAYFSRVYGATKGSKQ